MVRSSSKFRAFHCLVAIRRTLLPKTILHSRHAQRSPINQGISKSHSHSQAKENVNDAFKVSSTQGAAAGNLGYAPPKAYLTFIVMVREALLEFYRNDDNGHWDQST